MNIALIQSVASFIKKIAANYTTYSGMLEDSANINVALPKIGSQLLKDALDSQFNSKSELDSKKVMGAALLIAQKTGVLPATISPVINTIDATNIAEESFNKMKVAYKVATGELDVYEATDKLIEKTTARVITYADKTVALGIEFALSYVENSFPPIKAVSSTIRAYQPFITEKAQIFVKKGIQKLSECAKKMAPKVIDTMKIAAKIAVKKFLFS